MSDATTQLFTAALGLSAPWRVKQVRFEPDAHEIHFDVVCEAKRLPCSRCSAPDQPIHDRLQRDWQHLHFFQYRALIHAAIPRVRCSRCAEQGTSEVSQVAVPWARERSGFTLLFEAMVVTLASMSRMPVRKIGQLLGVGDARVWRSLAALTEQAYAQADMSTVTAVGVDEKHVGRAGMITVVHDRTPGTVGRVLHVSEGARADNVKAFTQALSEHGGKAESIQTCTQDMANSYLAGGRDHLPNAESCLDPFHLVKLANEAVDEVRRDEVLLVPELKKTRYHWLKDAANWTRKEIDRHPLRHQGRKTARAWRMKERLRDILAWRALPGVPVVTLMDQRIRWYSRSRLPVFVRLAKTFKRHLAGIRNMLTHANSNAYAESINADIQAAIARARGFRTFRNLRTVIYLLKGRVKLPESPFRPPVAAA